MSHPYVDLIVGLVFQDGAREEYTQAVRLAGIPRVDDSVQVVGKRDAQVENVSFGLKDMTVVVWLQDLVVEDTSKVEAMIDAGWTKVKS